MTHRPRPPVLRTLLATSLATLLGAVLAMVPAAASGDVAGGPGTVGQALSARLRDVPGGTVVGERIYYADGTVFVAVEAGVSSLSQCSSGQFCIWAAASYSGSFVYKTGQDVTRTLDVVVGSVYNNRARAARLYSSTGTTSTCYAPQGQDYSVGSAYTAAIKVYLSDITGC